ncbi:MAG TPA: SDR family NAD(P)-dependent oxidoreductase [Pseudomonadota bacterium]|nr:SDR family NAD(P)-dependent oxidoreductase [Pseudomonadota bacterium]
MNEVVVRDPVGPGSRLAGKVALISGGSGGMGSACARHLAAQGAAVALVARRPEALNQAGERVRALGGGPVLCCAGDVGCTQDASRVVAATLARFGRIDFLLAFAGYSADYPLISAAQPGPEQIQNLERIINVDLLGSARLVFLVEPLLRAQGSGVIITLGNTPTLETQPTDLLYVVAKAGNKQLMAGLAAQHRALGLDGLRAYFLAPHFIYNRTTFEGMTPAQRTAADADGWLDSDLHVAPVVSWLLSGALRRDDGASIRLNPQSAPQLFAEAGAAYPRFRGGE